MVGIGSRIWLVSGSPWKPTEVPLDNPILTMGKPELNQNNPGARGEYGVAWHNLRSPKGNFSMSRFEITMGNLMVYSRQPFNNMLKCAAEVWHQCEQTVP